MNSVKTDNLLQKWNTEAKNRLSLYLEQPVKYKDTEYPPGEMMLLSYICEVPGITSTELADIAGRTRGTISIAMKKMIEKGLVCFKDAPDHRKRKLIFPTLLGESLNNFCIEQENHTLSELQNILLEKYSPEEISLIFSAFSEVIRFAIHKTRRKDL